MSPVGPAPADAAGPTPGTFPAAAGCDRGAGPLESATAQADAGVPPLPVPDPPSRAEPGTATCHRHEENHTPRRVARPGSLSPRVPGGVVGREPVRRGPAEGGAALRHPDADAVDHVAPHR